LDGFVDCVRDHPLNGAVDFSDRARIAAVQPFALLVDDDFDDGLAQAHGGIMDSAH
jgi:hypothetical protein